MSTPPATNSIETQIDSFLGQFKRTASKAKDKRPASDECFVDSLSGISTFTTAVNRSQSAKFDNNDATSTDDVESIRSDCESRRSNNGTLVEEIAVRDVLNLLQSQYAIITGGKTKDMCPIITFPDNNNFQNITDVEYQRLMMYLTSVPSLQEADLGFHLIIDRRKDRWNSVKAVLLKISGYFPGIIHVAYVIRPASLLQKAISEVSNKLFKEEFKFRVIVCSRVEELHEYIDRSQLTQELGGFLKYSHHDWIQQRIELQKFSVMTKEISQALDIFLSSILETEFPNNVEATQQLLNQQGILYAELKDEILSATKHGEHLLLNIKENPASKCTEPTLTDNTDKLGNVFAVERLLVQLEETERTFDEFWQQHFAKLQQCLELRRFEQSFKELQSNFDTHLKTVSEMTEIGETVNRVDTLIQETTDFQKVCLYDIDRAEELVSTGQQLLQIKNSLSLDCIEPKCSELNRMCDILSERLTRRLDTLTKCRDLMERVEKANSWCTRGVELLASQHIEKCSTSTELAEKSLHEIQQFIASAAEFKLNSPKEFRYVFQDSITLETKALVMQVLQRIDDVSLMCDKRIASLKKLTIRSPRPVQTVTPERAMPLQPAGGAPPLCKGILRTGHHSINNLNRVESSDGITSNHLNHLTTCENDTDSRGARRGHTLSELLTTEQTYVEELYSILKGYKHELLNEEIKPLVPAILSDKIDVLFGNLDELYNFHANIFLRELENCITSMDLVASCFVQQKDNFFRLYSSYCQNLTRSEQLREQLTSDAHALLQSLQRKLNHQLPLAAYLLKPVQRITKYQLLLKDLHRYSQDDPHAVCDHQQLQEALNCMLLVLKCVNDSMLHVAITGYPNDLSQQGELLLQGSFSVWTESKKDLRLRLKTMQRHIFLYQKVILFCKSIAKSTHTKAMYQFKHSLNMSEIGLTESVKGDHKKFEVWLQGRQEVHTIQAATIEQKQEWVSKIKRVLFNQLEELKGEKIKQYSSLIHKPLRQTISWERQVSTTTSSSAACALPERTMSCDTALRSTPEETLESNVCWSSDYSNSEDEDPFVEQSSNIGSTTGSSITLNERITDMNRGKYVALADYNAIGHNEVSIKEGDIFELLKVGCAGWWFVRFANSTKEGWAPAAYLEPISGKKNRYRSQDALSD
ncbi:guanine nucleotide exchange factor DBS-like isoform X2 [Chrysoperla carnea]|uniref:guanine nucleotide exchange factor DBS-like isoform X2 n=1 Tax=Chrysoperla carnea TaxID=189513 RepID=UPI001D05F157|nr:guanine nucleotide exchange factor DBS-like isoform X2 [Chrysoperla carnea]